MRNRRPELDLLNPPGQIVNPIPWSLGEYIQEETKKMEQEEKILGQIAFEAWIGAPDGSDGWEEAAAAVLKENYIRKHSLFKGEG